jgi:hypothetical protein
MSAPTRGRRRDVQVLQAPGEASLVAQTQNAFLRALHEPAHGLPRGAWSELARLQPAARAGIAAAPIPHPFDKDDMHRLVWVGVYLRDTVEALAPWREWAERWRIAAPCVIRWAFLACAHRPEPGYAHVQYFVGATPDEVPATALTVSVHGHLLHETEEAFLARAQRAYRAAYKQLRATHAFEPLHPHPELTRHCEWTIARYVHRCSAIHIATRAHVSEQAVRRAIRTIASRIDLPKLTDPRP